MNAKRPLVCFSEANSDDDEFIEMMIGGMMQSAIRHNLGSGSVLRASRTAPVRLGPWPIGMGIGRVALAVSAIVPRQLALGCQRG